MKLQITAHNKTTTIEHESDDLNIEDMMLEMIIPALISVGFTSETIKEYIKV